MVFAMTDINNKNLIPVGVIANVHGIRGLVKVKSFTADPDSLFDYTPLLNKDGDVVEIEKSGTAKGMYLAKINGISDRNDAELLKGNELFITPDQLPELEDGSYYNNDLIGLDVMDTDSNKIGTVINMHNYGAGDLVEVKFDSDNQSELFLFATDVVDVNIADNFLTLEMPNYTFGSQKEENDA